MGDNNTPLAFDHLPGIGRSRCRGRHAIGRKGWSINLSEPARQVLSAWIVALFVLVAGCSVLVFNARDVRKNGVAAVIPQWYPPPVAGTEDLDEIPDREGTRAE